MRKKKEIPANTPYCISCKFNDKCSKFDVKKNPHKRACSFHEFPA